MSAQEVMEEIAKEKGLSVLTDGEEACLHDGETYVELEFWEGGGCGRATIYFPRELLPKIQEFLSGILLDKRGSNENQGASPCATNPSANADSTNSSAPPLPGSG